MARVGDKTQFKRLEVDYAVGTYGEFRELNHTGYTTYCNSPFAHNLVAILMVGTLIKHNLRCAIQKFFLRHCRKHVTF